MKTTQENAKNLFCLICLASESFNVPQEPTKEKPKLFPWPTTPPERHRWKKQIRDLVSSSDHQLDDAAICSLHFADDDISKYNSSSNSDNLMSNTVPFVSNALIDAVACERSRRALTPKCHFPNLLTEETPFRSSDLCLDLGQSCRICLLDVGENGRQLTGEDKAKIVGAGLNFVESAKFSKRICQSCSKALAGDLAENEAFQKNLAACNELAPHFANSLQINVGEYQMLVVDKRPEPVSPDDNYDEDVIIVEPPTEAGGKKKKRYFYYCYHCPKTYGEKNMLLLHLLKEHFHEKNHDLEQEFTDFQCEICGKSFPFATLLRKHRMNVHGKKVKRSFQKLKQSDQRREAPQRKCPHCEHWFVQDALRVHIQSVHKRKRNHHCQVCGKTFFRRKYLDDHTMSSHPELIDPNAAVLECHYCAFNTKNKLRYTRHVLAHHPEVRERPFGCSICSKEFIFAESLSRHHRAQHSKGGLYTCEECGQVLRNSINVISHKRMHEKMRETLGDWRDYIVK